MNNGAMLTTREISRLTHFPQRTVQHWAFEGRFPGIMYRDKAAGNLIPVNDVADFLQRREREYRDRLQRIQAALDRIENVT